MKREIEFRGRTAKGKWVYGSFINSVVKGSVFGYIAGNNVVEPVQVMRKTVGQYVGIKDKNGKKVYVGDIIKASHNFYPYTVFVRECKVCIEDKYGNAIRPTNEALKHFDCEVIGNIFDKENDNGD